MLIAPAPPPRPRLKHFCLRLLGALLIHGAYSHGAGWFRFGANGYGLYAKNHHLPGSRLLFSQRNGYAGRVFGKYFIEIIKPNEL